MNSMNPESILSMLAELRMLKYFPAGPEVMVALLRLVGEMCRSEDEVRWLAARMTNGLYTEWPGPGEMRACFCSKFRPKDGINAYSTVYVDGIPSEKLTSAPQISAAELKALPSGRVATADPELDTAVSKLADTKAMRRPAKARNLSGSVAGFARTLEETITAPCDRRPVPPPTPQIITQTDIDRAVQDHRRSKAKESDPATRQEAASDARQ